jgi:hypothetical protein
MTPFAAAVSSAAAQGSADAVAMETSLVRTLQQLSFHMVLLALSRVGCLEGARAPPESCTYDSCQCTIHGMWKKACICIAFLMILFRLPS